MNRSNKKTYNEEKSKNFKNPNKLNLNKVLVFTKKFICRIPPGVDITMYNQNDVYLLLLHDDYMFLVSD